MASDEQQVAPTPPWRKKPEHGNELSQPENPVEATKYG